MSDEISLEEMTEKKYLGKEATEKLIENVKNRVNDALVDKISYTEQALTDEQKAQARENIGVDLENIRKSIKDDICDELKINISATVENNALTVTDVPYVSAVIEDNVLMVNRI